MRAAGRSQRVARRTPEPDLTLEQISGRVPQASAFALHGDVLTVHADNFAWLPDRSIALVLTDPPFNIARESNFHTYEGNTIHSYQLDGDKGWDSYSHPQFIALLGAWAGEFARVLRPGGAFAIFCADAYVSHLMEALTAAELKPRRVITWRKPNAVPVNRRYMPMSACEYVVVGVKKGKDAVFNADLPLDDVATLAEVEAPLVADKVATIVSAEIRRRVQELEAAGTARPAAVSELVRAALGEVADEAAARVRRMYKADVFPACVPNYVEHNSKAGNRLHPTEKPVPVLRYLAALLSRPGDVVLDPFGGSGSTGEAVRAVGRRAVIVERDAEYYGKLTTRLRRPELP